MMMITFKEFTDIHFANDYDKIPMAAHLYNLISNELNAAAWANVIKAPSFEDYCEAIEN